MEIKPSIQKTLEERKAISVIQAESIRTELVASETENAAKRKTLAELDAEVADIDEFLGAPKEK